MSNPDPRLLSTFPAARLGPFGAVPQLSTSGVTLDDIRAVVREELAADRLARGVAEDLPRLTAEWDQRHGGRR